MRRQNEAMDEQMAGSVRRHDLDTPSGHSATRIRPAHASTAIHGGVEISQMSTPDVPLLGASALERVSVPAVRRPRRRPLVARRAWTAVRLLTDLGSALVAVALAVVASGSTWHDVLAYPSLLAFPVGLVVMLQLRGLYRRRLQVGGLDELFRASGAVSIAAMTVLAWEVTVNGDAGVGPLVGHSWVFALVLVAGGRVGLSLVRRRACALGHVSRPTLIVGAGIVGSQVARRLSEHPEFGLRPVGFIDADPPNAVHVTRLAPILGGPDQLEEIVASTGAEHVIFAFSSAPDRGLIPLTRSCEELGLGVSLVPRFFESINDRMALDRLGGLPLIALSAVNPKGWQFRIKYALDRPVALLLLLVTAPIMLLAALAVKLTSPGPVLFRQRRVGRDGRTFDILKFRSMCALEQEPVFVPPSGVAPGGIEGLDRRTPVGRFLRRSAIDELPQLFNVLRGDMSIVGPRPERPEFVERFETDNDRYSDRHRVKSGITGWAQAHGLRGQTSLADRVEWDNFYIQNWSLWLDVQVMLLTFGALFRSGDEA
jgi:exopolysaccharide biosynthesis polyprenyl glycosylphosphotransferase